MIERAPKPLRLEPSTAKDKGIAEVAVNPESTSFPTPRPPYSVPFFVPRDQVYYWTREWQEGEAEADEEIRHGELRRFSDIDEAMRWLDSPGD